MRKRSGNRIVIIVAIGLGMAVLGRLGALRPITKVVGIVTTPIMRVARVGGSSVGSLVAFTGQIGKLNQRNIELSQEVVELRRQLAADADMRAQNAILRSQLGFSNASSQQTVPAEVIAYQPDNFRAFVTINRGRHDGLRDGQAVTSVGSLVGKLVNTQDDTAQVFLISDPDFRVTVIDQESGATGTVHGQIGRGLELTNVPQDQVVKPGDTLVTSGLGGDFPKGLLVGRIEAINHQDNAIFQSAQVTPNIKIDQLEVVFVVIKS